MRTLFDKNILTPSPPPPQQSNPFDQLFHSALLNAGTPDSAHSSPPRHDLLTRRWSQAQTQQRLEATVTTSHDNPPSSPTYPRRRGNPTLLFMGLRKSGKTSIRRVVFEKLSPADTLFLEPTTQLTRFQLPSTIPIDTIELPSHFSLLQPPPTLSLHTIGAIIWVLDVQDEYLLSIATLIQTCIYLATHHPRINLEIFIHKTDGLSEEYAYEAFREVRQRVYDELSDLGFADRSRVSYHQTSIFDHSIFEAVSKVVQKLLPQLPAMEALLNRLCSTCRIQKAFLFDVGSKIYIAADASPGFMRDYEVCSDFVDVVVDLRQLYGWRKVKGKEEDGDGGGDEDGEEEEGEEGGARVNESLVTFDKTGDLYVYAREINEYLSLLCVMGKGSSADKKVLIDYNFGIVHDALLRIFKV